MNVSFTVFLPSICICLQQMKTFDDQHVTAKHNLIYPSNEELNAVQKAVQQVENALKEVSSKIHEQEMKVYTAAFTNK